MSEDHLQRPSGGLLRLSTAGSVDDGKSTLIGRLLYETKQVMEDQLAAVAQASDQHGADYVNLALLTDGLRAEREQGITIDVAYRRVATPRREFIIADTPGHIQYTRNMVTGASTADLVLILIDARNGILEQTRRHALLAGLLRVPHLVICINKMDLVGYSQDVFDEVELEFTEFAAKLDIADVTFIPVSALRGDNIVHRSERMPWYEGVPLLYHLEHVHVASDRNLIDVRFPVQYVIRPMSMAHHDYRAYAGQVAGGVLKPGDEVLAVPSGFRSRIARIDTFDGPVVEAFPPMSVAITIEDDIDISRGDMLCRPNNQPTTGQDLDVMLCWLSETAMLPGGRYSLQHTTRNVRAMVKELRYRLDINTLHRDEHVSALQLNEVGRAQLRTTAPLFYDQYRRNRLTGSLILVDEATNNTVAGGMLL